MRAPRLAAALLFSAALLAPPPVSAAPPPNPESVLLWGFFIPGGGYFRLGDVRAGLGYLGAEVGLGFWAFDQRNRLAVGEWNMPLVYLQQVHAVGMFASYRRARRESGLVYSVPLDDAPAARLASAPFRWSVVKSPWVWGWALAGAGINYAAALGEKDRRSHRAIGSMRLQGRRYGRGDSAWAYHAYWVPLSVGAGVSEEMVFRGLLQAQWEETYGPRKALWASSTIFGLAHLRDFKGATVANALFAVGAGYVLGRRTQANGYRLSETIAAHAWFDIAAGAALYLADPRNNPIGAEVRFSY